MIPSNIVVVGALLGAQKLCQGLSLGMSRIFTENQDHTFRNERGGAVRATALGGGEPRGEVEDKAPPWEATPSHGTGSSRLEAPPCEIKTPISIGTREV